MWSRSPARRSRALLAEPPERFVESHGTGEGVEGRRPQRRSRRPGQGPQARSVGLGARCSGPIRRRRRIAGGRGGRRSRRRPRGGRRRPAVVARPVPGCAGCARCRRSPLAEPRRLGGGPRRRWKRPRDGPGRPRPIGRPRPRRSATWSSSERPWRTRWPRPVAGSRPPRGPTTKRPAVSMRRGGSSAKEPESAASDGRC